MINKELIKNLHSVYPELIIDTDALQGYSLEEIGKMERFYDIKVTEQLYDFLICMGRCSGGLFGDDPLLFYREQWSVRGHILFQAGFRDELRKLQQYDLLKKKPFFISIESETQFYFVLTASDDPNKIYHYDENEEVVEAENWSFNEYLSHVIDIYVRNYRNKAPFKRCGELITIV